MTAHFATARSFDVLNLLAHLLDQQLELEARVGEVLRHRLRAERVGLAVELLHQKVQALADRPSGPDHAVDLVEVRSQAVQLLGDVRLDAEERDLLADALLVRAAEDLAKARGELFLVGGDRLGEPRLDRNEQRFEALHALEEHLAELFAFARARRGELLEELANERHAGLANERRAVVAEYAGPVQRFADVQRLRVGDRGSHLARGLRQRGEQPFVHADLRRGAGGRRERDPAFRLSPAPARPGKLPPRPVAIKEYLPSQLALRKEGDALPSIAEENLATFRYGLKCFFEEGKSLAGLSHPNVVRVLNFFRANETVYMVMRYERGRTLQEHIQARRRGAVKASFIRHVFSLLLNGLREVHSNKLLHLDIKPANIYIRNDGTPLLIDFGAARQTLTQEGMRLNPMYTPGFAPPEQYKNRDLLGPWSDCYAIGASIFACLAGMAPQPADQRLEKDRYVSATKVWNGKYSRQLLETIDWCLALDHMKRPQSVFALQKVLLREKEPEVHRKSSLAQSLRRGRLRVSGRGDSRSFQRAARDRA